MKGMMSSQHKETQRPCALRSGGQPPVPPEVFQAWTKSDILSNERMQEKRGDRCLPPATKRRSLARLSLGELLLSRAHLRFAGQERTYCASLWRSRASNSSVTDRGRTAAGQGYGNHWTTKKKEEEPGSVCRDKTNRCVGQLTPLFPQI